MALQLWSHPYAAYGQKASVALYELDLPFDLRLVYAADEAGMAAFRAVSPFGKMPVLVDGDRRLVESSIVIEYLDQRAGGGRLIPTDPEAALEARLIDRIVDTYAGGPMNRIIPRNSGPQGTRIRMATPRTRVF